MAGRLRTVDAVLLAVAAEVGELVAGQRATADDLAGAVTAVAEGAGELTGSLLDGLHAFDVQWAAALAVLADSTDAAAGAVLATVGSTTAADAALEQGLPG